MEVCFLINTYNRHESLLALVKSIHAIDNTIDIYILDDGSEPPITQYHRILKFNDNIHTYRQGNKGKQLYWQTCNTLFDMVRDTNYNYYYMLPDDVTVPKDFLDKTHEVWNKIQDADKVALNLITDRVGLKCWTAYEPIYYNDLGVWKTNWVDMAMMFNKKFFSYISNIPKVNRNWEVKPMLGSGVGSYISRQIFAKGGTIYMNKDSFVSFQLSHRFSKMNPKPGEQIEGLCYVGAHSYYEVFNSDIGHNPIFQMKGDKITPLRDEDADKKASDYQYLIQVIAYINDKGEIFY